MLGHCVACQALLYLLTSSEEPAHGCQSCIAPSSSKPDGASLLHFIATRVGGEGQVRSCRDLSPYCNSLFPWTRFGFSQSCVVLWKLDVKADEKPARHEPCSEVPLPLSPGPAGCHMNQFIKWGKKGSLFILVCYMNLVPSRSLVGSTKRTCSTVRLLLVSPRANLVMQLMLWQHSGSSVPQE